MWAMIIKSKSEGRGTVVEGGRGGGVGGGGSIFNPKR